MLHFSNVDRLLIIQCFGFNSVIHCCVRYYQGAGDYESHCQPVVIQHMDIAQPLSILRRLLEAQLGMSLADHEFWLQDQYKVFFSSSEQMQKIS